MKSIQHIDILLEFVRLFGSETAVLVGVMAKSPEKLMTLDELEDIVWIEKHKIARVINEHIGDDMGGLFFKELTIRDGKLKKVYGLKEETKAFIKKGKK